MLKTSNHSSPNCFSLHRLSVRLLVSGARTWTAELLWLAPSVVGNEEGTVVGDECLLQLVLGVLVDVLLVVCDLRWTLVGVRARIWLFARRMSDLVDVRCSWQWLDGWHRPARCDHRHERGRGCRHRL